VSQLQPIRELEKGPALARLCVVSFIQFVGVLLTYFLIYSGPSFAGVQKEVPWQNYCLGIAYVLFVSTGVLVVTFFFSFFFRWRASIGEGIIWFTFAVNIIAFSLAMARTGGPAHSFFGQLVPLQLSGILLLQQQKAMLTCKRRASWLPTIYTVFVWLTMVIIGRVIGWKSVTTEPNLEKYELYAAGILFLLGLLVTALAYWLPTRPSFIARFQSSRDDHSEQLASLGS
jgi:hypothetical protein